MFAPENGERSRATLVPAVAKTFRLLDVLSASETPLGTSELARRLGLGKSTVHGLVTTLTALGILDSVNGTRRYRIGHGLRALVERRLPEPELTRE